MAMTAVDLLTQPQLLDQAKAEFEDSVNPNAAWRMKRFTT
jgi:hypothetical protein